MADVKGDLAGTRRPRARDRPSSRNASRDRRDAAGVCRVPGRVLGRLRQRPAIRCARRSPTWGRCCFGRLLGLNETQRGVLTIVFKIADDAGLLLLDLKDLRAMLQFVGDNAKRFTTDYGNISAASIGAIQRGLLALDEQGGDRFFGEPMLDVDDLIQTGADGRGVVNILAADKLIQAPKVYATFLLWLLSELFERLPEVGDSEKPKIVFFFDEAHLLFTTPRRALVEKIEQVVRLIRSKGVGVYFVTQNPLDIPETVLGQLGHRVQHALARVHAEGSEGRARGRATRCARIRRSRRETAITELAVGEALVSFLDDRGAPTVVERAWILPPASRIGAITPDERTAVIGASLLKGHYEQAVDRESAYEKIKAQTAGYVRCAGYDRVRPEVRPRYDPGYGRPRRSPRQRGGSLSDILFGSTGPRGGKKEGILESAATQRRAIDGLRHGARDYARHAWDRFWAEDDADDSDRVLVMGYWLLVIDCLLVG